MITLEHKFTSHATNAPIELSVIVPTYNRATLLPEAIKSVEASVAKSFEIVIVDDGSTDATEDVVRNLSKSLPITYLRTTNRGPGPARNIGLASARGRILSFLDSDDLWHPEKWMQDDRAFNTSPDVDCVVSDAEYYLGNHLVAQSWLSRKGLVHSGTEPYPLGRDCDCWVYGSIFPTSGISVKRAALAGFGNQVFPNNSQEDWTFENRLHHDCNIWICPKVGVVIRRFFDKTHAEYFRPPPAQVVPNDVSTRIAVLEEASRMARWPATIHKKIAETIAKAHYSLQVGRNSVPWNDSLYWS